MRPAPTCIDGASTEFMCICARVTGGLVVQGWWWWRRRTKGAKSGEGQGAEDTERVARSRSRREKPSKCRGPCIQAARRADGTRRSVAACTGLIAGHRSTDVPMRERNERKRDGAGTGAKGSEEERKGEAERKNGRAEGGESSRSFALPPMRVSPSVRADQRTIMGEYLIGGAQRRD